MDEGLTTSLACSTSMEVNDEEDARVSRESWLKVKQSSSEVAEDRGKLDVRCVD